MRFVNPQRSLIALAVLAVFAGPLLYAPTAGASLIYGDIAGGNQVFSGYGMGPGGGINNYIAEGFTMTGNYNLQSVDIFLSSFSDNAGVPGTDLYDLATAISIPLSGTPADVNSAGTGSFTLTAGMTYWLELYATNPSSATGDTAQWDGEFTPTLSGFAIPTGPGAVEVGQRRTFSGGTRTDELRTAFQLNGVAIVPEPSSFALVALGLGVLTGFGLRRRQWR